MINIPEVKLGVVAVSRDCFPIELSKSRKEVVMRASRKKGILIKGIETVVENEKDVLKVLKDLKEAV